MKYLSTRGAGNDLTFKNILFAGLASDGGLYVPEKWPVIDFNKLKSLNSYSDLALEIIYPFINNDIGKEELKKLINNAYADFSKKDIITFKMLKQKETLVELFNGPTLAFKDFAMQLIVPIFDYYLSKENKKLNLIVATSGDTGSAAISAVQASPNINIFCLFPKGRISKFQRKQMSTLYGKNIFPIEIDGTFDDCQNIVKTILIDKVFSEEFYIAAVNSINWSRVMIQIVYYFHTLIVNNVTFDEPINFSVPTGNFGDIYAGYVAYKMGLPINKLIIATNENDILDRFLKTGVYSIGEVTKTTSPSMDIAIASNFERLLFDLCNKSTSETSAKMIELDEAKRFSLNNSQVNKAKNIFDSKKVSQEEVSKLIQETYNKFNYIIDPHTAIGLSASRSINDSLSNNFILSTAHPIKFSETVEKAIGRSMDEHEEYADMFKKEEKFYSLDNSTNKVKEIIKSNYNR